MASLHKDPRGKSPYWYCAYTKVDGKRCFRSTKSSDKKQSWQVCNTWSKASSLGTKLTPDKARQVIASGVADVLMASGQTMPSATIRDWCKRWLEFKEVENEPRTHERYQTSVKRFLRFLGSNADKDLTALRVDDVIRFRDDTAQHLSVTSTNMDLKVLRACLYAAVRQDLLDKNVATKVSVLKQRGEHKRRAFTLEEVRKILSVCGERGGEWKGLVLTGVYTGQRLGDVAHLTWSQLDLQKKEISFVTAKTGKRLRLSIAKPLLDYYESLPSVDKSDEYVFPVAAAAADKHTGTISTKFYDEILVSAGCVPARLPKNESSGKGRGGKRVQSEVSFHSFRHTLTTWLKGAGASNALAQMIIGHDSEVVSRGYTHLSSADSIESMSKLPDVTK
jgi:integrase